MKTVLRNDRNGAITHLLACVEYGQGIYLTPEYHEKFMTIDNQEVRNYYSGDPESEYESLIEDITELVTGELDIDNLRYRIFTQRYGRHIALKIGKG